MKKFPTKPTSAQSGINIRTVFESSHSLTAAILEPFVVSPCVSASIIESDPSLLYVVGFIHHIYYSLQDRCGHFPKPLRQLLSSIQRSIILPAQVSLLPLHLLPAASIDLLPPATFKLLLLFSRHDCLPACRLLSTIFPAQRVTELTSPWAISRARLFT